MFVWWIELVMVLLQVALRMNGSHKINVSTGYKSRYGSSTANLTVDMVLLGLEAC